MSIALAAATALVGVTAGSAISAMAAGNNAPSTVASAAGSSATTISVGKPTPAGKLVPVVKHAVVVKPASAVKHAPAAKSAAKPTIKQLMPHGTPGGQQHFTPNSEQKRNAAAIVRTGRDMGLPPRAWVMAVACSLQESALHNLGSLGAQNDHDSLGLFQQRPSAGWGTPAQIRNPHYAARQFYKGLTSVHNWRQLPLTSAVQKVQVSAYPDAYAKWEKQAVDLILAS